MGKDIEFYVGKSEVEKGGKGSGHHGHKGIKGRRGGSAPSRGGGAMAPEKKYEWSQRINMMYWDQTDGIRHGGLLQESLENAPYMTKEAFQDLFNDKETKKLPKPTKTGDEGQQVMWAISQQPGVDRMTAVEVSKITSMTGLSERSLNNLYDRQFRDIVNWETRANLNQWRFRSDWVGDSKKGIVNTKTARKGALRVLGYTPSEMWIELQKLA